MTTDPAKGQWSAERARQWAVERPWICGCNFLPSTAVNFLEMWRAETFDAPTIARELGWARAIGLNALRVNLPFLVWKHDRDGLIARIDRFLDIAAASGLDTALCLFDDCGFGGAEPVHGPQPDPVPGVHNSRAVASPGRRAVMDQAAWPDFEAYLRDVIARFADDPRVLFWDLYNEPGNRMIFTGGGFAEDDPALEPASHALMRAAFGWTREINPSQPLTVAAWTVPGDGAPAYTTAIDRDALALSDIVSFHAYAPAARVAALIDGLAARGRPMLCTEWMARAIDSRIEDQLPLFASRGVGAFNWGLVRGRTQTWLPWPDALVRASGGDPDCAECFHDLLDRTGAPFHDAEVGLIRNTAIVEGKRRSAS